MRDNSRFPYKDYAMSKDWNPDEIKQALDMDIHLETGEDGKSPTFESLANKKLREGLPLAVARISNIMLYSDNEPLAARCAQWWIEKVLGKADATPLVTSGDDDKLRQLMEGVVRGNPN